MVTPTRTPRPRTETEEERKVRKRLEDQGLVVPADLFSDQAAPPTSTPTPTPTPRPAAETDSRTRRLDMLEAQGIIIPEELRRGGPPPPTPTPRPVRPTPTPRPRAVAPPSPVRVPISGTGRTLLPPIVPVPAEPRRGFLERAIPGPLRPALGPVARFGQGVAGSLQRFGEQQAPLIFRGPQTRIDELIRNAGFDPEEVRRNPDKRFEAPGYTETVGIPISTNRARGTVYGTGKHILEAAERVAREEPQPQQATAGRILGSVATLGLGEEPLRLEQMGGPLESLTYGIGPGFGPVVSAFTRPGMAALQRTIPRRIPPVRPPQLPGVTRDISEFFPAAAAVEPSAPRLGRQGLRAVERVGEGAVVRGPQIPRVVMDLHRNFSEAGGQGLRLNAPRLSALQGFLRKETPLVGRDRVPVGLSVAGPDGERWYTIGAYRNPVWKRDAAILWKPEGNRFTAHLGNPPPAPPGSMTTPGDAELLVKMIRRIYGKTLDEVASSQTPAPPPPFVAAVPPRARYGGTTAEAVEAARRQGRQQPIPVTGTGGRPQATLPSLEGQVAAGAARNIARGRAPRLPRLPTRGPQGEPVRIQVPEGQAPPPGFVAEAAPQVAPPPSRVSSGLVDELLDTHLDRPHARGLLRGAAERLEEIPGFGPIIRAQNPSAVARLNPPIREGLGYRLLEQGQDAQLSFRLSEFAQRVPFSPDKNGRIAVGSRRIAFGDVAENPGKFVGLVPEQRDWFQRAFKYIDDLAIEYETVSGKPLRKFLDREHYWPRFVRDTKGKATVRARVGARQSPIRQRIMESMEDGLEEGVPYEASPLKQLELYGRAIQKMTRDEILIQRLKAQGLARPIAQGRIRRGEVLPDEFALRGFQGLVFDEQTARVLRGPLGREQGWLRPLEMIAAVPRLLVTGLMDTGQFMIQGITLLAHSPKQWARSVGLSLRSIAQPRYYARWISESPAARRAAEFGVNPGDPSEFFQAAPLIGRIPGVGQVVRGVQRGFDAFLGSGRISMFDGLADAALAGREGRDELFRLARIADTMLGTPSTKGLAISATQRQVENVFLFFSPRYTRSVFGALGYMFGKGFGPQQVRKILGKMLFGGAATYYGLAKARGMSDIDIMEGLNPQSGKRFMNFNIGGANFGLGGAYRSLLAFMGALTDKDRWDFDNWGEGLTGNPVVRYLRSRTSPLGAVLADAIEGQDYIGRPFSLEAFTDNPKMLLDQAINRGAPFPVQAFLEVQGGVWTRLAAAGVEAAFGLRVSPTSFLDAADKLTRDTGLGRSYSDLEQFLKRDVEKDPRVQEVAESRPSGGLFKTLEDIDADYDMQMEALVKRAQSSIRIPGEFEMLKGSDKWKRIIVGRYFDIESGRFLEKAGARRHEGTEFADPDSQVEQDMDAWYRLAETLLKQEGILIPGVLEEARKKMQRDLEQDSPERWAALIRNVFLREVPPDIFKYLSETSKNWRKLAEDEREKHRKQLVAP